jgi:hypothetical protein
MIIVDSRVEICCVISGFLDYLNLEDLTGRLSRNVGN